MADDFIIYFAKGYPPSQLEKDKKDFQRVHILRGRFIHYMSLLEFIMKEYCGKTESKLTVKKIFPTFIDNLKKNNDIDEKKITRFKKNIERINAQRDKWAHSLIWYKKRNNTGVANNYLGAKTSLNAYFGSINKRFEEIFSFLHSFNLISPKSGKKTAFYQVDDSKYDPKIT